jgi:hypothetical protein
MQQHRCPKCGAPISFGVKFCSNCGGKLSWQEQPVAATQYSCPACNAPVIPNSKNCTNCGTPLNWQTPPQNPSPPPNQVKTTAFKESGGGNKVLKGIGIAILSLLLFLSLSAFGPAFMVDRTVLNPGFVASEVDSLEITTIVVDAIDELPPEEIPPEIKSALSSTVTKLEPMLKQEFNSAVYSIYDYLKDKRDSPELLNTLRNTLLSNDFLFSTIDELDTTSLIKSFIEEQLPSLLPTELSGTSDYIYAIADEFLVQEEDWIKEQMKTVIVPVADYLVGDIKNFKVEISLEPLISDLKETILQNIEKLQIPIISLLPEDSARAFLDDIFDEYFEYIPSTYEFRDTMIGAQVPAEIASSIASIESVLDEIKEYVGIFQTAYILLIVFMLLLIAGIVLIYREVKGATRTLGIVFFISGLINLVFMLVMKGFATDMLGQAITDLPSHLQTWLIQLVNNLASPLQILSIGFIAGGIVLIVISIIYRPRVAA